MEQINKPHNKRSKQLIWCNPSLRNIYILSKAGIFIAWVFTNDFSSAALVTGGGWIMGEI